VCCSFVAVFSLEFGRVKILGCGSVLHLLHCAAMCCIVLQRVVVRCRVMHCVAVWSIVLQRAVVCCRVIAFDAANIPSCFVGLFSERDPQTTQGVGAVVCCSAECVQK